MGAGFFCHDAGVVQIELIQDLSAYNHQIPVEPVHLPMKLDGHIRVDVIPNVYDIGIFPCIEFNECEFVRIVFCGDDIPLGTGGRPDDFAVRSCGKRLNSECVKWDSLVKQKIPMRFIWNLTVQNLAGRILQVDDPFDERRVSEFMIVTDHEVGLLIRESRELFPDPITESNDAMKLLKDRVRTV